MAQSPEASSQATQALGFQEPSNYGPPEITQESIDELFARLDRWHQAVYPDRRPPMARQAGQFRSELGEVGEEVFARSPENLAALPESQKIRIGSEIVDVFTAGFGLVKALGYRYEELRVKHETDVYDSSLFSEFEKWQIDANGGDAPVHVRLTDFGIKAFRAHKLYDEITDNENIKEDINLLSEEQKRELAQSVAGVMTSGLSVLNGMELSFEALLRDTLDKMEKEYPEGLLTRLRALGMDDSRAMATAKAIYKSNEHNGPVASNVVPLSSVTSRIS